MSFLSVKNLSVIYTSEGKTIHAVNDVSFDLEKGKCIALVGETGAGKTTIAKSILRILPDHAAQIADGSITLEDADLLSLKEREMCKVRGKRISMVFQDPMTALNPIMKIGPQVAEAIREHDKVSKKEARRQAEEMLKMVGIQPERYENYPHEFSGGMKQRVVIAMALACHPDLLIADEPTTALDVTIQAQVIAMIKNLREQFRTSLLLITHDLGVVASIADDVAVVYGGEIIEYGSKEDIYLHAAHPYTQGLFKAIPNLETESERLTNIKGLPPDPSALPDGCCFAPRCEYATEACGAKKIELTEISAGHNCRCCRCRDLSQEESHE